MTTLTFHGSDVGVTEVKCAKGFIYFIKKSYTPLESFTLFLR